MGPTSAIVLFAVIWFMVLFIVLPYASRSQADAGEIVPGTHASAPADFNVRRTVRITTIWAVGLWIIMAGTILSGVISVRDLDWFNRMSQPDLSPVTQTN